MISMHFLKGNMQLVMNATIEDWQIVQITLHCNKAEMEIDDFFRNLICFKANFQDLAEFQLSCSCNLQDILSTRGEGAPDFL